MCFEKIEEKEQHLRMRCISRCRLEQIHRIGEKTAVQPIGFFSHPFGELIVRIHQPSSFFGQHGACAAGATPVAHHQRESQFLLHMVEHMPCGGIGHLHQTAGILNRLCVFDQMQKRRYSHSTWVM